MTSCWKDISASDSRQWFETLDKLQKQHEDLLTTISDLNSRITRCAAEQCRLTSTCEELKLLRQTLRNAVLRTELELKKSEMELEAVKGLRERVADQKVETSRQKSVLLSEAQSANTLLLQSRDAQESLSSTYSTAIKSAETQRSEIRSTQKSLHDLQLEVVQRQSALQRSAKESDTTQRSVAEIANHMSVTDDVLAMKARQITDLRQQLNGGLSKDADNEIALLEVDLHDAEVSLREVECRSVLLH
eukprot:Lankesteria_metandrocarpae@DN4160_c0_g1_i4.p1